MPTPTLKALRSGLLLAVLTLLLLLALEGLTRTFLRLRADAWPQTRLSAFYQGLETTLRLYRAHPYLNTAPREGIWIATFDKAARLNGGGYRSPERDLIKLRATQRILFSGDSTTFDLLAASNERSWLWQIESQLRDRDLDIEVWNAGFPGWTTLESTIALLTRDLDLAPDVIVLFQGIHDLQPAAHHPFDPQYEHGHADLARRAAGFDLAPLALVERSVLLESLRDRIFGAPDPWQRLASGGRSPHVETLPEAALATIERNVRAFVALGQSRDATVVLVTQAVRLRANHLDGDRSYLAGWIPGLPPDRVAIELERVNAVLRHVASDTGAHLVDAAHAFDWLDTDFPDPMHFSAAGSERFAHFLRSRLETLLPAVGP